MRISCLFLYKSRFRCLYKCVSLVSLYCISIPVLISISIPIETFMSLCVGDRFWGKLAESSLHVYRQKIHKKEYPI